MGQAGMERVIEDLDSKDTKRRLRSLELLDEDLQRAGAIEDEWQQLIAPLVRTLRDNNFKVCRGALSCLEMLVGHVGGDIVPFLSTVIPAVVDCLGNSKTVVQDKGIDLLVSLSSPTVNGVQDTLATLEGYFRHKNWRVREYLMKYLAQVTEVDGDGVAGRPALATVLADALNDSASQVRQQALEAAARLVESTGTSLLTKLEAKGVRSAQMLALRDSPPRSDKGRSESMSALSVSSIGGGVGDRSPTISPVPSRAGVSLLNGGKASGAAGAGGNGVGRLAGSRRRALREVPSSRVGPLDSTGTGGASPCPAGPALSAKAPAACSNASGVSGANEESAFFALEPVVPVKVYTERDVRREVEAAKAGLDHGSDWQIWVGAMRRLAGVALGGGAREFPGVLVGHVRASVHEAVGHKVSENRSAVAREACRCVAVLARCLKNHFGSLAELWLPELLRNTTRAVVVAAAGDEAARAIFGCTTDGFPRLLTLIGDSARNKSAAIRRRCLDYAMLALARWNDPAFERHMVQTRDMIGTAIADADSSVRATARRAYWVLRRRFPSLAESIMESLGPSMQRHVLREEREFDAEAFVKAAAAAAETPQPALGESLDEDDLASAISDETSTTASTSSGSPGSTFSLGRRRGAKTMGRNISSSSSSSSLRCSSAKKGKGVQNSPTSRMVHHDADNLSTFGASGGGGGGMKRVKVERGAPNGNGNSNGDVGNSSARASRVAAGEAAPVRVRPRVPLSAETPDLADSSFGSSGAGMSGVNSPPLRVASGAPAKIATPDGTNAGGGVSGAMGTFAGGSISGPLRVVRATGPSWSTNMAATATGGPPASVTGVGFSSFSDPQQRAAFEGPQRRVVRKVPPVSATQAPSLSAGQGGESVAGGATIRDVSAGTCAGIGSEAVGVEGVRPNRSAGGSDREGGVESGTSGASVMDRRDVLRQMDSHMEQASVPHWAARVEAIEGLLELLTVSGAVGSGREGGAEGGRHILESRSASKRLEAMVGERLKDAHFRVLTSTLRLLGGLVEAHPAPMAGQAFSLLPSVFPCLADAKEPVRTAASRVLDTCRAVYSPLQLCAALCPRILELAPGRARTGLLEFLAVLVPHASGFLTNPGHLHALMQRLGTALLQIPLPSNWEGGGYAGVGGDGGEVPSGKGDGQGSSPTTAAASGMATVRLVAALFRMDRDAFIVSFTSMAPDSASAMRQAIARSIPEADTILLSKSQRRQERSAGITGARVAGSDMAPPISASEAEGNAAAGQPEASRAESWESPSGACAASTPPTRPPSRVQEALPDAAVEEVDSLRSAYTVAVRDNVFDAHSSPGACINESPGGHGGNLGDCRENGDMVKTASQDIMPRQRQPLAHITLKSSNASIRNAEAPSTPSGQSSGGKERVTVDSKKQSRDAESKPTVFDPSKVTTPIRKSSEPLSASSFDHDDPAEVVRMLIGGLSPGSRTYQKVAALSSLKGLADGEGAGGQLEFWPRYFGQVLMLLLEGASGRGSRGSGGGVESSPSRRRTTLRVKHMQGVRCLVKRRGSLFPAATELVVQRLVEIGGGPCHPVRHEAEACLGDLVAVLEPSRYLAVLVSLLSNSSRVGGSGGRGHESENGLTYFADSIRQDSEGSTPAQILRQCVVLGALRALTPTLSSPDLLGSLGAGPLLSGLEAALEGKDLEARRRAVLALVEMYQVLEEALLPFISKFPTSRLKLITLYIEQRRADEKQLVTTRVEGSPHGLARSAARGKYKNSQEEGLRQAGPPLMCAPIR